MMNNPFKKTLMTFLVGLVVFFTHFGQFQACFSRLSALPQTPVREDVTEIFQEVLDEAGNNATALRINRLRETERRTFSEAPPMAPPPAETIERFIRAHTHSRYPPESRFDRGPPSAEQLD